MIREFIQKKKATQLCVGPMSKNCIDASIELSEQFNVPQILIASRRQVDAQVFGGGYVEKFTTEQFAKYVKGKNAKNVLLARDHGGPWQGAFEHLNNYDIQTSMEIAKRSFEDDVLSGFDFIHIDPSIPVQHEQLSMEVILDRLFELYGHTYEFAQQNHKNIQFELGTEEQNGYAEDLGQFEYFLNETQKFCKKNKIQEPTFVVAQTGTKVMETKNVGEFTQVQHMEVLLKKIHDTLAVCKKYDVMLKEHNTDYLSDEALALRPLIGIHASNVAPEFGVVETKGLLYLFKIFGYKKEFERFVEIAVTSKKWEKWMLRESCATQIDKAIICGHYIFANEEIVQMKQKVYSDLMLKGIDVDQYLKRLIKQSMTKYMQLFKMI